MEKIQPGKYVEMTYDLYKVNPDGSEELFHQVDAENPEAVIYGITPGMVVPLEKALEGMDPGSEFDVTATADEAYGHRSDEYLVTLEKDVFMVDGEFDPEMVKEGAELPMMTADGFRINGVVKKVGDKEVVMDFNHPLADATVRLKGKVTVVRDATPDEIKFTTGEGCGCGSCGCDSGCNEGGCNDNTCGCDHKGCH